MNSHIKLKFSGDEPLTSHQAIEHTLSDKKRATIVNTDWMVNLIGMST